MEVLKPCLYGEREHCAIRANYLRLSGKHDALRAEVEQLKATMAEAQKDNLTLSEVMLCDAYEKEADQLRALVTDLYPLALVYAADYARTHGFPDRKLHPIHQKMIDAAKVVADEVLE